MHTQMTVRRIADGQWTIERDGVLLVGVAGVDEDELADRLASLLADGELEETDRLFVVDRDAAELRRLDEVLAVGRRPDVAWTLAHVRAERYASVEHYI
jgi:hypothetical protein